MGPRCSSGQSAIMSNVPLPCLKGEGLKFVCVFDGSVDGAIFIPGPSMPLNSSMHIMSIHSLHLVTKASPRSSKLQRASLAVLFNAV